MAYRALDGGPPLGSHEYDGLIIGKRIVTATDSAQVMQFAGGWYFLKANDRDQLQENW